jgi:hypothetical protein
MYFSLVYSRITARDYHCCCHSFVHGFCSYPLCTVSVTTCSLHDLIFCPEDAGNIFLHNTYMYVTNYSNHILKVCNFHHHHHECLNFHSLQFVSNLTRCGTRSVSTVQTVTDLWIQYWHVMVLTARYTARHAIQRSLVPRALVMAMLLLWCLPMENQLFLST